MDLIIVAYPRTVEDTNEWHDDTVITNHHIVFDIHEGEYLTIIANLRLGAYLGLWRNFTCHNYSLFVIHYSLLLRSASEGLVQTNDGLHLIELIGNLIDFSIEQVALGGNNLKVGSVAG